MNWSILNLFTGEAAFVPPSAQEVSNIYRDFDNIYTRLKQALPVGEYGEGVVTHPTPKREGTQGNKKLIVFSLKISKIGESVEPSLRMHDDGTVGLLVEGEKYQEPEKKSLTDAANEFCQKIAAALGVICGPEHKEKFEQNTNYIVTGNRAQPSPADPSHG